MVWKSVVVLAGLGLICASANAQAPAPPSDSPVRLLPNYIATDAPKDGPRRSELRPPPAAPVPYPVPAAAAAIAPWEHLMLAAGHLDAAGLKDEAARIRERATEQSGELDRLRQKMEELERLQAEVQALQAKVGQSQQIDIRVKLLEFSPERLRAEGLEFPGIVGDADTDAVPLDSASLAGRVIKNPEKFEKQIQELRKKGLLRILGEPHLVTTNGRPASILVGGEFPVPVARGVDEKRVQWREFGLRLEAVATMLGGRKLRLEVQPEISERDFAHAVVVDGKTVPALTTRRINTQVELNAGEMLIISGLRSRRGPTQEAGTDEDETRELLVLVTADFVQPSDRVETR